MERSVVTAAAFGLLGLCLIVMMREFNRETALLLSIATSLLLFLYGLYHMRAVWEMAAAYMGKIQNGGLYCSILVRVLLTAYAADFTAQLCRDAGETSIASKVELVGKVIIFAIASPVILSVMELISRLISP